jgi:hypothetical protein
MTPEARRLAQTFDRLAGPDRATLLAFAEFLAGRSAAPALAPVIVPRPADESVIQAVKRLKRSYPMLERRALMQPVGALVSAHMLDGRPAAETIDALEALFAERCRAYAGDAGRVD